MNYLLPADVVRLCARHRVTGLTCVPPLWMQIAEQNWPAEVAERLRYFANTGGRMPKTDTRPAPANFPQAQPYLMYGLTEAFRSTYLDPAQVDRRPDSIGKAIPNAEILVVRPDGTRCDPGEEGELVHRGALVALGYWNDPERTAERFRPVPDRDASWRTPELAVWSGDAVVADEEGFLYFVGRKDDMIKTSGLPGQPDRDRGSRLRLGHGSRRRRVGRGGCQTRSACAARRRRRADPAVRAAELICWHAEAGASALHGSGRLWSAGRDPAVTQRQVRPGAVARGVGIMTVAATPGDIRHRSTGSSPSAACRWHGSRSGSDNAVLRLRPRAADRQDGAAAEDAAASRSTSATRSRPIRCRLWCSTWRGWSTRWMLRPRWRCARHWTPRCHRPHQLRRSRQDRRGDRAGGGGRRHDRDGVCDRVRGVSWPPATHRGSGRGSRSGSIPISSVKGSGMRMGGGPQQFGVDAERVPAMLADIATADVEFLGFHVFAGSQNLARGNRCRSAAQDGRSGAVAGRAGCRPRSGTSTLAAASASPTSTATNHSTCSHRRQPRRTHGTRISPNLPDARVVIELGRYIVGECGVYITKVVDRKESRGQDLSGGRRRPAPSTRGIGQLRSGHPPQLPGRCRPTG